MEREQVLAILEQGRHGELNAQFRAYGMGRLLYGHHDVDTFIDDADERVLEVIGSFGVRNP